MGLDGVRGEASAADRGADALAAEVARQARGVADEQEPGARESPRRPPAHDVGVAAKRLEDQIRGQATRRAQGADEDVAPPEQVHARAGDAADADVEDVRLREVPAVTR